LELKLTYDVNFNAFPLNKYQLLYTLIFTFLAPPMQIKFWNSLVMFRIAIHQPAIIEDNHT